MSEPFDIREVADDDWDVVAWLWQAYRNDQAHLLAGSFPWPDGRYKHVPLDAHLSSPDHAGYLARRQHPQLGEPAPVGFALVDGLRGERRSVTAFWVVPAMQRTGLGNALAHTVIARHPGPWTIAFQHDNVGAGQFWRRVAEHAFGVDWTEELRAVPGMPDVPPDHWIESS